MNRGSKFFRSDGFALLLTVVMLGLLVLAVCGLAVLVRSSGQVAVTTGSAARARQNALFGLAIGLAELQRSAGGDHCATGMAGITGVPAGATRNTRHWCGVWKSGGSFDRWLVSGAGSSSVASLAPGVATVTLVGGGAVGADSTQSEHVVAGKVPIATIDPASSAGSEVPMGAFAYLVLDEGVKVSAWAPPDRLAIAGVWPQVVPDKDAQTRLRSALDMHAARLPDVISYEQLAALPAPAATLTPSTLQDNFHHVTLTALMIAAGGTEWRSGMINLNTASPYVWAGILAAYNVAPGAAPIPAEKVVLLGRAIAEALAGCGSGKAPNGPFSSVAAFGGSSLLGDHLPEDVPPEEFMTAIGGMLAVRSDTFRIRAYGETPSLDNPAQPESLAYCEALVQRTPEMSSGGSGRRFVVHYFRWLAPGDI